MLVVSDYSLKGVRAAGRIRELTKELRLEVDTQYLILNRAPDELDTSIREEIERQGVDLLGVIPVDEKVFKYDLEGTPIMNLPDESTAVKAVSDIMEKAMFN
jgi:CO dehydrogenase maturation factor